MVLSELSGIERSACLPFIVIYVTVLSELSGIERYLYQSLQQSHLQLVLSELSGIESQIFQK